MMQNLKLLLCDLFIFQKMFILFYYDLLSTFLVTKPTERVVKFLTRSDTSTYLVPENDLKQISHFIQPGYYQVQTIHNVKVLLLPNNLSCFLIVYNVACA